jgi:hypothetical protein
MDEVSRIWGEAFKYLWMAKIIFFQSGQQVFIDLEKDIKKGKLQDSSTLRLSSLFHARACQLLCEIINLIRAGFADAALTRWRTLHEMHVLISFIIQEGDCVAERYLDHETIESYKAAKDYRDCYDRLGFDPISDADIKVLKDVQTQLVTKYGKAFAGNYGWAADALGIKKPTFKDIAAATNTDHLKSHYRLASHGVHANPKGILCRLSQPNCKAALIAGPSVYGLAEPITCTVVTAAQLFSTLNLKWGHMDGRCCQGS